MAQGLECSGFQLRSQTYYLKGNSIPGFTGWMTLENRLTGFHRQLADALADFFRDTPASESKRPLEWAACSIVCCNRLIPDAQETESIIFFIGHPGVKSGVLFCCPQYSDKVQSPQTMRLCAKPEGFVFSVPVRGMSCIQYGYLKEVMQNRFRPREGYELHPKKSFDLVLKK